MVTGQFIQYLILLYSALLAGTLRGRFILNELKPPRKKYAVLKQKMLIIDHFLIPYIGIGYYFSFPLHIRLS